MALADGACVALSDGTVAHVAHRTVRDGARVALLLVPDLLRFDVYGTGDAHGFAARNLSGRELARPLTETDVRPYSRPDGPALSEYQLLVCITEAPPVRIVLHRHPFAAELERRVSAVALIGPV
jgi:hypothetical protein